MKELRRAFKLAGRLLPGYTPKITKIWFETTDRCNSHCTNCNKWAQKPTEDILTPEEVYNMLSDPVFKDVEDIINSGGEPTTRDDLYELLIWEHFALPNATIQLSTNGLLPGKVLFIVDLLLDVNPRLRMEVGTSLDGIGTDHDKIRGVRGNFDRVDYLLTELVKLRDNYGKDRLGVSFGTVLTDKTVDKIQDLQDYANKKDVGMLVQWYNQSSFYSNKEDTPESREKMKEVVKGLDYTIISDMWCNWLDGKPIKFNCMALQGFCAIKCNGDIVPCLNLWDTVVGNVRSTTPTKIFKSGICRAIREVFIDRCEGCVNSWGTFWSFEADPIQYVNYFIRHPIKLVRKLL